MGYWVRSYTGFERRQAWLISIVSLLIGGVATLVLWRWVLGSGGLLEAGLLVVLIGSLAGAFVGPAVAQADAEVRQHGGTGPMVNAGSLGLVFGLLLFSTGALALWFFYLAFLAAPGTLTIFSASLALGLGFWTYRAWRDGRLAIDWGLLVLGILFGIWSAYLARNGLASLSDGGKLGLGVTAILCVGAVVGTFERK